MGARSHHISGGTWERRRERERERGSLGYYASPSFSVVAPSLRHIARTKLCLLRSWKTCAFRLPPKVKLLHSAD